MGDQYGDSTLSVLAASAPVVPGAPLSTPPVPASAYHLSDDESADHDTYGRSSNPTWRQLEQALARLEGAAQALCFSSGMAAITSTLRVLTRPGSVLVVPGDGYYQVRRWAAAALAPAGVTVIEARTDELADAAGHADVVLAETPSNPGLDVVDLHRLGVTCRSRGAVLVVDNTTATPLGLRPLSYGADLVVASATKALAGHSDVIAGYVAGSNPDPLAAVAGERLLGGSVLGPWEAWLVLRSVASVGLRFDRQCHNALALATMLRGHPAVRMVRYPGLPADPSHRLAAQQMKRFGGLVGVELADARAVHALVAHSELLMASTSFGGLHTTVDRRARWGDAVPEGFARISCGIEDTDDLLRDVGRALSQA